MKRKTVFWFSFFTGPLILLSYLRGVNAVDDPIAYWGDVSSSMQQFIVPWMFVAAIGYLLMWYQFFFVWSEDDVASLNWPGKEADGKGTQRLMLLYAAFLLPSMMWIDATRLYLEDPSFGLAALTIGILAMVGLASVGFGMLAWSSRQTLPNGNRVVIGSVMLSIQCTFWDAIYWVMMFPW
ncbi:MAG TPA: hypothetical protein QGI72_01625 [Poseidonia sp.]|nr:hypothetical protein [Poseidonia sp.]